VRVALVGFGAVGRKVAGQLAGDAAVESLTIVHREPGAVTPYLRDLGDKVTLRTGPGDSVPPADVTVLAIPSGNRRAAEIALGHGSHVIACADDPGEVRQLMACEQVAKALDLSVVIGAAMAPGLGCVLAAHLRSRFERVDEVHVASVGTGGPSCARRHHLALTSLSLDWEDGEWRRRPGGSGRELVWFPEPVGGADCYRAGLADPLLLVPAFPTARRVTSRLEATRRDRMTSWLPMMRRPACRCRFRGVLAGGDLGVPGAPRAHGCRRDGRDDHDAGSFPERAGTAGHHGQCLRGPSRDLLDQGLR